METYTFKRSLIKLIERQMQLGQPGIKINRWGNIRQQKTVTRLLGLCSFIAIVDKHQRFLPITPKFAKQLSKYIKSENESCENLAKKKKILRNSMKSIVIRSLSFLPFWLADRTSIAHTFLDNHPFGDLRIYYKKTCCHSLHSQITPDPHDRSNFFEISLFLTRSTTIYEVRFYNFLLVIWIRFNKRAYPLHRLFGSVFTRGLYDTWAKCYNLSFKRSAIPRVGNSGDLFLKLRINI